MNCKLSGYWLLIGFLGLTSFLASCTNDTLSDQQVFETANYRFATFTDALAKGRRDLLALSQLDEFKHVGIDAKSIVKAEMHESINMYDINVEQLLRDDSVENMKDLVFVEKGRVTPLYSNNRILLSIVTRIDSGIWSVSGYRHQFVEADIEQLRKVQHYPPDCEILCFEIPVLNAHLYAFADDEQQVYYSNYHGLKFDTPVDIKNLFALLKADALKLKSEIQTLK